jgi:hypothetical protein
MLRTCTLHHYITCSYCHDPSWQIIISRLKPLHCFTNQYITYLYRLALPSQLMISHPGRLSLLNRYIEYNIGKSARQGNLRHPRVRFQSFTDEAHRVSERLKSYSRVSEISLSCTFCRCLILFRTFISRFNSCVLLDSNALLADDHVNNVSYFPFMSIKKVVPYFCVLREGYYVIIWLIVRICVFIKDWKLIYSELFILKISHR